MTHNFYMNKFCYKFHINKELVLKISSCIIYNNNYCANFNSDVFVRNLLKGARPQNVFSENMQDVLAVSYPTD